MSDTSPSRLASTECQDCHEMSAAVALGAGSIAGLAVDTLMYPLETIKTRLQCISGFQAAGGSTHLFRGLSSTLIGSAPTGALFFAGYEGTIRLLDTSLQGQSPPATTVAFASCVGECIACLVRVPTENVKQNMMVNKFGENGLRATVRSLVEQRGIRGLWAGYGTTVARDTPFSMIQFVSFELMRGALRGRGWELNALVEGGVCGFAAGGFAALCTTPFDVVKTRIMLGEAGSTKMSHVLTDIWKERKLFAGMAPRVLSNSLGGMVFLGSYSFCCDVLSNRGF